MNKTVAIIDIGTNTFNLLVAEVSSKKMGEVFFAHEFPVKLGEGGINRGYIAPAAFQRGLDTLREIHKIIQSYRAEKVVAFATSAIRSAANGVGFMETVKSETGIEIETIDGDREALLIYKGVTAAVDINEPAVIMDIGGGSVEFILCDVDGILWKNSFPIGAARLKEQFHHSDPISLADIDAIYAYLNSTLDEFLEQCTAHQPSRLIASAGAFETFAEMIRKQFGHPAITGSAFNFDRRELQLTLEKVIASNQKERETMPGLVPFRVDMIVMAAVLTRYVLERTHISSTTLSFYSLKEGILVEMAQQ